MYLHLATRLVGVGDGYYFVLIIPAQAAYPCAEKWRRVGWLETTIGQRKVEVVAPSRILAPTAICLIYCRSSSGRIKAVSRTSEIEEVFKLGNQQQVVDIERPKRPIRYISTKSIVIKCD